MTYPPDLDAVGGRSYKQSSQTPGALTGRRDVVQWYKDGAVSTHNMIVKVAGAAYRLVEVTANVRVAPTAGSVKVDILAQMPGEASPISVFDVLPSIPIGQLESSGGVFNPDRKILPIGTLVSQRMGGTATADLLIALGKDASPREQSRLIGGTWDTPIAIAGIASDDPRIYPITATLWFATNDDDGQDAWGWGVGARTKNGGDAWSATPDPGVGSGGIKHIAADAGGRLWCIVHDLHSAWRRTKIYYSEDDADNWTLSTTYGTGASPLQIDGWKVIPHPTDQDTIAIIGFSGGVPAPGQTRGFILITKNRGSSWAVHTTLDIRRGQGGVMQYYDAVMLSDGRILVQGPFTVVFPVKLFTLYSDTDGATWQEGIMQQSSNYRINGLYVSADEDTIAYILSDSAITTAGRHRVYVSTDKGETYSVITLAQELQGFVGLGSGLFMLSRFVSSTPNAAMYVATNESVEIAKLTPISSSGAWTDLTDAYPHSSQGNDNLGILPGDAPSGAEDITVELHHRTRAVSQ